MWAALLREFAGATTWWLPELEFRPVRAPALAEVGTEIEVIPHVRGERRLPGSFAFVARVVELVENERLVAEYVRGAFLGRGEWELQPVADGTRLRMRWHVRSHGLLATLTGLVVDAGELHSHVMQTGFRRLDALLAGESTRPRRRRAARSGRALTP